jgi:hypothetical protein
MKLDYKKLWQQQKKQNILLRTENERLEKKFIKVEFERNEFKDETLTQNYVTVAYKNE